MQIGYLSKCYTQKLMENDQGEDPEPDGWTKLERIQKREGKIGQKNKKTGSGSTKGLLGFNFNQY